MLRSVDHCIYKARISEESEQHVQKCFGLLEQHSPNAVVAILAPFLLNKCNCPRSLSTSHLPA